MLRNQIDQYGNISKTFHWLLALLFIIQMTVGFFMGYIANKKVKGLIFMVHKSNGLMILFLSILFFLWTLSNVKPVWRNMPTWEKIAAQFSHGLLYAGLLFMPLTGWLASTAAGYPPLWFGLIHVPMPGVSKDKLLSTIGDSIHVGGAWVLLVVVLIHIGAALRHHYVKHDTILRRMWF